MYRLKKRKVWASDIADYLNAEFRGEDFEISSPEAIRTPTLLAEARGKVAAGEPVLLISDGSVVPEGGAGYIRSDNPDRDLAYVLLEFFTGAPRPAVHPTAQVSEEAALGRNVTIGAHSIVEAEVEIGNDTRILNNVVLHGPARIGKGCVIKDGAVIGSEGYRFVKDEHDHLIHPPQLGRILIGDRVWIGANSTVERATIKDTVIEEDVKVDDLVHVGSGSQVGRRSLLTAGSIVAYDVTIGDDVSVGANASIRPQITVAPQVIIGMGAVVVSNLTEAGVYVGAPARRLEKRPRA